MAYTNITLITDALRDINVINEVQSPSAEQGTQGLRRLNHFMEHIKDVDGINLGWFEQTSTTDTCPIPLYARGAIQSAFAIFEAPQYSATISGELSAAYKFLYGALQRKFLKEKLTNTDMSHLPMGQGHYGAGYDITTDV